MIPADNMSRDHEEHSTIATHREEASAVKDCFTQFSFQALAISGVVMGVIAAFQPSHPAVGFGSTLLLLLVLAVARIGNYKYATANRHHGYELHLSRTRDPGFDVQSGWSASMREVGWEEAMRAWRVVQATVFAQLYEIHKYSPNRVKKEHLDHKERWFELATLLPDGSEYYAGSYLGTIHRFLHTVAILCLLPFLMMVVQYGFRWRSESRGPGDLALFYLAISWFVGFTIYTVIRIRRNRARRIILEKGLLSIHSSAIMWQAVVLAHFRARQKAGGTAGPYENYTKALGEEAGHLKERVFQIHKWIMDPDSVEPDPAPTKYA